MRKILLLALALGLTLGTTGTALADGAQKAGTVTYDINLKTADGAKTPLWPPFFHSFLCARLWLF